MPRRKDGVAADISKKRRESTVKGKGGDKKEDGYKRKKLNSKVKANAKSDSGKGSKRDKGPKGDEGSSKDEGSKRNEACNALEKLFILELSDTPDKSKPPEKSKPHEESKTPEGSNAPGESKPSEKPNTDEKSKGDKPDNDQGKGKSTEKTYNYLPRQTIYEARACRTKERALPTLAPEKDETIEEVVNNMDDHVLAIYEAICDTSELRDFKRPPTYMAYLTPGNPLYDGELIKATAFMVFHLLIDRCRFGYSGPPRVAHYRRKDDPDAACKDRCDAIVQLLIADKCECTKVMMEETAIRKLVDAPFGHVAHKKSNQKSYEKYQRNMKELEEQVRQIAQAQIRAAGSGLGSELHDYSADPEDIDGNSE